MMVSPDPDSKSNPLADPVALAWHDTICPESDDCRDRVLHALSQTVYQYGILARFLERLPARTSSAPVGYTIVERHVSGPNRGRLDNDWDGEIHESLEVAKAELAEANRAGSDDPTQTPSDHWKLYELRLVGDA